jgi:hypothetical protein
MRQTNGPSSTAVTLREEKCVENNTVGYEISIEDHDHCKGMFFQMSFGGESLNHYPAYLMRDTVLHDCVMKRSINSLAQYMPFYIDSAGDYACEDGPHLTSGTNALDLKLRSLFNPSCVAQKTNK